MASLQPQPLEFDAIELFFQRRDVRRVSFENGILKDWQSTGLLGGSLLADLKSFLNYRHWLAHGRYWEAHLGRPYDYYDVATLAQQVEQLLALTA